MSPILLATLAMGQAQAIAITSQACTVHTDNTLRYTCTVTTDVASRLKLVVRESGVAGARLVDATGIKTAHTVELWGFKPNTNYSWLVVASPVPSGTPAISAWTNLRTGSLSGNLNLSLTTVSGTAESKYVMIRSNCGTSDALVALETKSGKVAWYEEWPAATVTGTRDLQTWTETAEGTLLSVLEHSVVVETTWDGTQLWERSQAAGDFTDAVHHDVTADDQYVYVLAAEEVRIGLKDYVIDGLLVLDRADGAYVDEWDIGALYDPTTYSGLTSGGYWSPIFGSTAIDFSHATAIDVRGTDVLMGFKNLSELILVDSDPSSATFGDRVWTLAGDGSGDFSITSSVTSDLDFAEQHHSKFTADGTITLFDNREPPGTINSRALEIELDEVAGTADIVATYDVGEYCTNQGSATPLPSGKVLVACTTSQKLQEFDSSGTVTWEATVACANGTDLSSFYRGTPSDLGL